MARASRTLFRPLALLAPVLLTIGSLLTLYADYIGTMSPGGVLRTFAWLLVLLILFALGVQQATHNWDWTGICLTVIVLVLFHTPSSFKMAAVVMLATILIWCCVALVIKGQRRVRSLTPYLAIGSACLAVVPLWFVGRLFALVPTDIYVTSRANEPGFMIGGPARKPDIYLIVLDGYGRGDLLRDYYAFDNSDFESYLRSKGFVIPERAHANYAKTIQSVTSTLNMQYVQELPRGLDEWTFWWLVKPYIDDSRLQRALEQAGYQTYAAAVDWDITDNPRVDRYFPAYPVDLSDFEGLFLNRVPLGLGQGIVRSIASTSSYEAHRKTIQNDFVALSEIARAEGDPKFVFVHIIAMHAPYVFDAEGDELTPDYPFTFNDASDFPGDRGDYRDLYIGQVRYINGLIEQAVDQILSHSERPAVIILQADHGPGMFVDLKSPDVTCMRDRYAAFAAYRLPGVDESVVPEDITPVNVFRIVLDHYFGTQLGLLPNHSYFPDATNLDDGFVEVGARVNESCSVPLVGTTVVTP